MERTVAKCLLEIKAIFFGFDEEYIAPSGARLPIYCDNRLILSYPRVRKALAKWMTNLVNENYPDAEMIVGTSVPGISLGLLIAENLGLPITYVFGANMDYGFRQHIEGLLKPGKKIVIIDDVICTGDTLIGTVQRLREIGCDVLGGVSLFSYELDITEQKLKELNITYKALTNFHVVTLIGQQTGRMTYDEYTQAQNFKQYPFTDKWYKKD